MQRPVLPPGTLVPIHPVAFLVVTRREVYGLPVAPELRALSRGGESLSPAAFGLSADQLGLIRIEPQPRGPNGETVDTVGIVTTFEGEPLQSGDIASRLGDLGLSRAVGQALGRNPIPIIVPCHRVLAAQGKLGGFSAPGGAATKRRLLEIEGARGLHPTLPWGVDR